MPVVFGSTYADPPGPGLPRKQPPRRVAATEIGEPPPEFGLIGDRRRSWPIHARDRYS
ncbi:hypothetical protein [Kitasatospora sp. NPDC056531]|uniref:hypothetical protein n=1 Tax=Kitasatospora sp. NPDC056531 TaxID=3345856 RepID=UPI0036BFE565